MQRRNYLVLVEGLAIALITVVMNSAAMAQNLSGAIFTTNTNHFVNANVYNSKTDVYLNGGPRPNAPCTAAGLPNGIYYFQVTDPSGAMSLHDLSDPITDRQVEVAGGVIVAYLGSNPDRMADVTIGKCPNSIIVPLFPFVNTPNPGGEYKVWMTNVLDYDGSMTKGSFGFIPSKSKTDNFKVAPPVDVDSDGDGTPDSEDPCPNDFGFEC
jgi:hypothetical protein